MTAKWSFPLSVLTKMLRGFVMFAMCSTYTTCLIILDLMTQYLMKCANYVLHYAVFFIILLPFLRAKYSPLHSVQKCLNLGSFFGNHSFNNNNNNNNDNDIVLLTRNM
jgi:hypothetical protein